MGTKLFDQEAKANRFPGSDPERGKVIQLFAGEEMDGELLSLARAVGVERADRAESDADPDIDFDLEGTEDDGRILNAIMDVVERVTRDGGPLDQMAEGAFGDPDAEMGSLAAGIGHRFLGRR